MDSQYIDEIFDLLNTLKERIDKLEQRIKEMEGE